MSNSMNHRIRSPSVLFETDTRILGSLSLGCGVLADLTIATTLWYYLRKLKAGYRVATSAIVKLSIYAVSTGLLTSAIGLATLLCFYLMTSNLIFVGIFLLLSKLYGVSLLAALNTRRDTYHNESVIQGSGGEFHVSDAFTPLPSTIGTRSSRHPTRRSSNARASHTNGSSESLGTDRPITTPSRPGHLPPLLEPIPHFVVDFTDFAIPNDTGPRSRFSM
ncbi:hypothetical protein PM082_010109 [Marasmius tenuissimus]|nr:hypothetical protein PM082_010109 [Marasmius tenuissimus]